MHRIWSGWINKQSVRCAYVSLTSPSLSLSCCLSVCHDPHSQHTCWKQSAWIFFSLRVHQGVYNFKLYRFAHYLPTVTSNRTYLAVRAIGTKAIVASLKCTKEIGHFNEAVVPLISQSPVFVFGSSVIERVWCFWKPPG